MKHKLTYCHWFLFSKCSYWFHMAVG